MIEKRLPRKFKKMLKKCAMEEWITFLDRKKAHKEREEHIDKIFTRNYKNAKKVFHKMLRHER